MTMKKLIILIPFIIIFGFVVGCSDDFLKEEPRDEIFAENLFVDYKGFTLAKNALLHFPREERGISTLSVEMGMIWKIGTDVGWANQEFSWSRGLNQYTVQDLTPTMQFLDGDVNNPTANPGIFLFMYRTINTANLVIDRANNPDVDWMGGDEATNQARKNEIIAHARLIKAWAYRHLVMTFGAVPLSVNEITGETYRDDWTREPVEVIQEVIKSDLLFAETWLPDQALDVTRLPKTIAQHYLAELYLWQDSVVKAEEKARLVVENPNFSLIKQRYGIKSNEPGCPFMDQFYDGNVLPSQGNTEALWVFTNSPVDNKLGQYNNTMRRTWVSSYNNLNIEYKPEYGGRGIGRAAITAWVFSIYEPNDHRYGEFAIRKKYVDRNGNTIVCDTTKNKMVSNNYKWASTRKWDWTFDDPARYGESYAFGDQCYLRLADTYLLLAEALHKQGKNSTSDGAAYYINQIRERSNATPVSALDVSLDFILDERARELVTEENRRETLVRTGKLIERTRNYNHIASGERDGGSGIQDFHVLLPIPQRVIEANVGALIEQNEGYN